MRTWCILTAIVASLSVQAESAPLVTFSANMGQWPDQVLYRAMVPGGALFVERDRLTYVLRAGGPHHGHGPENAAPEGPLRAHAYQVRFVNGEAQGWEGASAQSYYENYFIGNDPTHWAGHVPVFAVVLLHDLYPGIDLRIDGRHGLKYEFIAAPGTDPSVIGMVFTGQDDLELKQERLHVRTTAGEVIEEAPFAYQEGADGRIAVDCAYRVGQGQLVDFRFDSDRDNARPLVIDPVLTFATYTGSNADNFGFTATYDGSGHLYGGGIVFGVGYPTTLGVLDPSFNGNYIDIGVSKFSLDGNSMIWSTYIGGTLGNETPQSMVVDPNDELYILTTTGSADFPTTAGCFDPVFHGGTAIPLSGGFANLQGGEGYDFANGSDIAVVHLANDAGSLLGATFLGGSGNDGLNNSTQLVRNYGDHFRGEIALTDADLPVVASSTQSADMPTTAGAPQGAFGGGTQDAYLCRLDPSLSNLQFATYYGGSQDDSGYGVQFASNGEVFMSGGTASSDLPMAGTPFDASYNSGVDGYVARFAANGNALLGATYLGTTAEDQCYFVQLNTADEVFVVGQTHGNYPVTPGKYANPGSSQFIQKLSQDLSTSMWSTVIGSGQGTEDISPAAFLVSDCGLIYFSGWGGEVNHYALATSSTTQGLPITPGAAQTTTDGSDFYLMVLDNEAAGLNYATFFGGGTSKEHVDGGTSRFDKHGNVYQAVCAGCGGNSDFPTTPGAWSPTNNSFNCNLGVFKFNLSQPVANVAINGPPYLCHPDTAHFLNLSVGGNSYSWSFGDGDVSSQFEPAHAFPDPGIYQVMMVLSDTLGCAPPDTTTIQVEVVDPLDAQVDSVPPLCPGGMVQLQASGGLTYAWSPPTGLSDPSAPDPIASPPGPMTYTVAITDQCGTDSISVPILFENPIVNAGPDTLVCAGSSVPISAFGGVTYAWSPAAFLDDASSPMPLASPPDTTWFFVDITSPEGCTLTDSLLVTVQYDPPDPLVPDTAVCRFGSVQLQASGGSWYAWSPVAGISDLLVPDPVVTPPQSMAYPVLISNACAATWDTAWVEVIEVLAQAWPDTIVCPNDPVPLMANGGTLYQWQPPAGLSDPTIPDPTATVSAPTTYAVIVSDAIGCADTATVSIAVHPAPQVDAGHDQVIDFGDEAQLHASGDPGVLVWSPDEWIDAITTADPIVHPQSSTTYTVLLTDTNGCKVTDVVTVIVNGSLYVPNTFTPNGDGINDLFFAQGKEIKTFKLYVFNRWGEQIFQTDQLNDFWDGTYNGVRSPIDTYVWRVDYTELSGEAHRLIGHVNLVR
ncbi:MAG: gliding motility-associated C-terminal domain-containing protein [Flavobacteriales bacterium]|nr:gliding motility-associated C-terminal domain-containing protein [Flavobacteriales bacterium]MCB9193486.1 gliding motility-associated C-terminal domain-containing protein [Flavobacteriales bacterium]